MVLMLSFVVTPERVNEIYESITHKSKKTKKYFLKFVNDLKFQQNEEWEKVKDNEI